MSFAAWLLLATSTSPALVEVSPPREEARDEAPEMDPSSGRFGIDFRVGYEATWMRLSRVGFDGQVSGLARDPESYRLVEGRPRLVTHGVTLGPGLFYQPSGSVPLQLTVGLRFGLGFGRLDYAGTAGSYAVQPDPDRLAASMRASLPVGLRLDLDGPALRAALAPGVMLVAIDEILSTPAQELRGTSTGFSESVRGELGVDLPVVGPFGLSLDAGYDFGLAGGWFLGAGFRVGVEQPIEAD